MSDPATTAGIDSPEVSFVVIAYNEQAHVAEAIASILAQESMPSFEVVVVDDGSRDRTADVVEDLARVRPEVRLVRHATNSGRGAARKSGVQAARGRFVAMVDADIALPRHWWSSCRAALAEHDVVGGTAVPDGDVAYVHRRSGLTPKVRHATTVVTGNNGAYRGEVLRAVEFDERLTEGEDIAINHLLRQQGFRLSTIDGLLVEHREDKGLLRSVLWLFESGVGATRQLVTYREIRTPDLATAGWLVVVAAAKSRQGLRRAALPVAYLACVTTAHLAQRFELDRRRPVAVARAFVADITLLLAYFTGRLWGVPAYLGRRSRSLR